MIYQGGDYFGRTVNTAARVAAYAAAGEMLVTDDVVRNCTADDLELASLGEVRLKGVPDPILLHRAMRRGAPRERLLGSSGEAGWERLCLRRRAHPPAGAEAVGDCGGQIEVRALSCRA